MGQEPYTFAILLREKIGVHLFHNVRIYATDMDMNNNYGPIVKKAQYLTKDLERIPPEIFQRYFEPSFEPGYSTVVPEIRNVVEFHKHDLLTYQPIETGVHLIICKNVLLHFTMEERINVWNMFYNTLEEGGFMLHEHTQKLPGEVCRHFEQVVPNAQIFRKVNHADHKP